MRKIRSILKKILDFLVPPLCIYCKKPVVDAHAICKDCFMQISFIDFPCCDDCGAALAYENSICTSCLGTLQEWKQYDQIRSVFEYDEFSKLSILALKHGDATYVAKFFANIMYSRFRNIFSETDLILYVPIHFKRLLKRHYNQAALIAVHIGKCSHKNVSHDNLIRVKNTKSQQGGANSRARNVKNAFKIRVPEEIVGKKVVIIDDVFTTGATLNECSRILKEYGAINITCCTIARAFSNITNQN